jgi:hypothetical protein
VAYRAKQNRHDWWIKVCRENRELLAGLPPFAFAREEAFQALMTEGKLNTPDGEVVLHDLTDQHLLALHVFFDRAQFDMDVILFDAFNEEARQRSLYRGDAPAFDGLETYRIAVASGDCARVRRLLDGGVPVDAPIFGHGATALVWAVAQGEEMVRLLLERGASARAEDWEGVTPLRVAQQAGHAEIIALLRAYGAE